MSWSHFAPYREQIESLAEAGLHHTQIHQALQLPATAVKLLEWCKRHGISVYSKKRSIFDPWHKQLAALAPLGLTTTEMIAVLGLPGTPAQLGRHLRRHGIEIAARPGGWRPRGKQRKPTGVTMDRGYRLLLRPDHPYATKAGYVREHRLVMEECLGRYLEPGEVVHHKNGDPADNRIENLELFASNGEHLAETLQGQTPNWTEGGRESMRRAVALRSQSGEVNPEAYATPAE